MEDDYELEEALAEHGRSGSDDDGDSGSLSAVKEEVRMMNIVRTFLFAIMITFSTIASQVVFVVVRLGEENNFKEGFDANANSLIDGFLLELEDMLVVADTLSSTLTLQANAMKTTTWPFVTFDDFDTLCLGPRRMAHASAITFSPLLLNTKQNAWERYAVYVGDQDDDMLLANRHDHDHSRYEVDSYDPHEGHNYATGEAAVFAETNRTLEDGIFVVVNGSAVDFDGNETAFPIWQQSPHPEETETRMFNELSSENRAQAITALQILKNGVMADFMVNNTNGTDYVFYHTPHTALYYPVFEDTGSEEVSAAINLNLQWETFLEGAIEDETEAMVVVVESSCGGEYSFEVRGPNVTYLGEEAMIPEETDTFVLPPAVNSTYKAFEDVFEYNGAINASNLTCQFRLQVYATEDLLNSYLSFAPQLYQWIVLGVFLSTIAIFLIYDCFVEYGSNKVVETAKRTDKLVSTLFPSEVKHRLLEEAAKKERKLKGRNQSASRMNPMIPMIQTPKLRLQNFLGGIDGTASVEIDNNEPIADLFPNASVMFADISGFTAWSSERDPSQVFKLLETLYRSMDSAARRLKVFKVETIGDCYVAASGLPEQREDHVEAIARFAKISLLRTAELTSELEATLGPGTSELALRFGIHSGPVTAGVLRGEKARFQLFGDTMNFAARMESTGIKNKVHLSSATAEMLIQRGKSHWVEPRGETVYAKGKGELQTYWLKLGGSATPSVASVESITTSSSDRYLADRSVRKGRALPPISEGGHTGPESVLNGVIGQTKATRATNRLVEWNCSALALLLKKVVVYRTAEEKVEERPARRESRRQTRSFMHEIDNMVVRLPDYDKEAVARAHEEDVELPLVVQQELQVYVAAIASGYQKNAFHNFEHCSHVLLSATKLLKRISYADGHQNKDGVTTLDLHQYTCGISSDPLTQFAVVFAALIHDVGHIGVSNEQMAEELPELASLYEHQSIAEQRSVDVALELLNLSKYDNLRKCICATDAERTRFRQILLHCALATDIFEKELVARRNERWKQAFPANPSPSQEAAVPKSPLSPEGMNRKATIVLEHIIQASDVAHTMQHWHVYIKWNERLFREMYAAFKAGRSNIDPIQGWYKGELWFFDNYVIPLAKKLKECGVFGVSSDEYLNYALQNREEWEQRGEHICRSMVDSVRQLEELNAAVICGDGVGCGDKTDRPNSQSQQHVKTTFHSEEFTKEMQDVSCISDKETENSMDVSHRYLDH